MHAPRTRVQRRPVHGVLLLDKPLGLSSNDALQKAKWLLRAEKAGHTGTLAQREAMPEAERLASLEAPESLLAQHVRVTLDGENAARFLSGVRRRGTWPDASAVAVFGENPPALLGVGHIVGGELVPDRLLSPLEIQQILEGMPHPQASGTLEKL